MTAARLKNPIILQPQPQLRSEIWEFQQRQQESRQQRARNIELETSSSDDDDTDYHFWSNDLKTSNLSNRREHDIQYQLARDRIPEAPAYPSTSLYQSLASWYASVRHSTVQNGSYCHA